MITIVDYGMGNLGSILNMLKKVGADARISDDPKEIDSAEKLLLPGVGAFDQAVKQINERGLLSVLNRKAMEEKVPVLGICLGMQLLTKSSEEGTLPGLGWIDAKAIRIPASKELKVPHMGWNIVEPANSSDLTRNLPDEARFYFVHSFAVQCSDEKNAILRARHGILFDAAIQNDNVYGAQFHPEKSHKFGMLLLKNFASL